MTGSVEDPQIARALASLVAGDVAFLDPLRSVPDEVLAEVAGSLPELVVTRAATARVLSAFLDRRLSARDLEAWAGFVRWGYFSQWRPITTEVSPPRVAIDIDFRDDPLVTDIVARLDEIGDDGPPDDEETRAWLQEIEPE
jgi:hypothetical protein